MNDSACARGMVGCTRSGSVAGAGKINFKRYVCTRFKCCKYDLPCGSRTMSTGSDLLACLLLYQTRPHISHLNLHDYTFSTPYSKLRLFMLQEATSLHAATELHPFFRAVPVQSAATAARTPFPVASAPPRIASLGPALPPVHITQLPSSSVQGAGASVEHAVALAGRSAGSGQAGLATPKGQCWSRGTWQGSAPYEGVLIQKDDGNGAKALDGSLQACCGKALRITWLRLLSLHIRSMCRIDLLIAAQAL